ncbi:ABC transporter ATP-binding protein [Nocardia zapadnayensis]|uniref:ABC transporter ATP-binding protein n=1 Tax=Nocardia rhamnosiphila TaxID=426716 RepID=UPI0022486F93|nr:ABC transporter ATP-binding protein [Nocardia zapadnayensis]MCX0275117.1 ABC transporter ATP-binding protein [Nocardia zapadnayensis]
MDHSVVIENLSKRFRRRDGAVVSAIDDATIHIDRGEFIVLLGPSGCGKTTLLRSVAGLETPDSGTIRVGDQLVFDSASGTCVPPERRRLSMMFQSYALWPHMTARKNVRYPLENQRRGRLSRPAMRDKVDAILTLVGIGELGDQYPAQLSGGQQQRVALARALVNDSDVVLFDEPLSNVDAKVREQLRIELLATQKRLGFTALFVTHDQSEAMELATRIAVLDQGRVQQLGTPEQIYSRPATEYVAKFIGNTNELAGRRISAGDTVIYTTDAGEIRTAAAAEPADAATLLWRPESGHLFEERPTQMNGFEGRIVAALFMGTHTEYLVRSGSVRSRVWTGRHDRFRVDDTVWIGVRPEDIMVFPRTASVETDTPDLAEVAS